MFSNLSASTQITTINYPITDSDLPFAQYIQQCQTIIADRREDLTANSIAAEAIIQANSPFEYYPEAAPSKIKHGALMTHGLLDCPFTFREIGAHLRDQGILTRAVLLPGHGTRASDLLHVTYHDWLQAVRYGIEALKKEVESVYLIGYSTGAALSIYHALQDTQIDGIILLSPAIKIRIPVDLIAGWHYLNNSLGKNKNWVYRSNETDYTKYKSITYNSVRQVSKLTDAVREMGVDNPLKTPVYMILSREDETISSHDAIDFFTTQHHPESKMRLYTTSDYKYPDPRIETHKSIYPTLNIAHLSHPCLTFSAENPHYGQQGDYQFASLKQHNHVYGAYNRIEINAFKLMAKSKLVKAPRHVLTYNPDFANMTKSISNFIQRNMKTTQ